MQPRAQRGNVTTTKCHSRIIILIMNCCSIDMIGRIYEITSPSLPDICYIGSTTKELWERWFHHKELYQSWCYGYSSPISIFHYFKQYGIESFKLKLLKEYEVVDVKHLRAYEQLWLNRSKTKAVNRTNPVCLITPKMQRNINKWLPKVQCGCGSKYRHGGKSTHIRSKKHIKWVSSAQPS